MEEPVVPTTSLQSAGRVPALQSWRRLLRHGRWYFLVVLVSFGYLAVIPYMHAYRHTRDRRFALQGVAWLGTAVVVGMYSSYVEGPAEGPQELLGLMLISMVVGACWHIQRVRRLVYAPLLGPPKQPQVVAASVRDEAEVTPVSKVEYFFMLVYVPAVLFANCAILVQLVRQTLLSDARRLFYVGDDATAGTFAVVGILFAAASLLFPWAIFAEKLMDDVGYAFFTLVVSVTINMLFAFSLWTIAVDWVRIDSVTVDTRRFGLLLWWNLVDAIPLLDVDDSLSWEKPWKEYNAGVGSLLLVQRLVLVVTLARATQSLVSAMMRDRPQDDPATPRGS